MILKSINMPALRKISKLLALALFSLLLYGCGNQADPVRNSGFLPSASLMHKTDVVPVQRVWKNPKLKNADYTKIIVKPVNTNYQLPKTDKENNNIRTMLDEENQDMADFAKYTEEAFKKAIQEDKNKKFQLVTQPGPHTLVLELALVKVVPGKPVIGALKNAANLTPIGAMIMPLKMGKQGYTDSPMQASVAIEGRLTDSLTGEYFVMFADRRKQKTAVFNANDFTAYGNLRQIVDSWANGFVTAANKRPLETGEKYEDNSSPINIINY